MRFNFEFMVGSDHVDLYSRWHGVVLDASDLLYSIGGRVYFELVSSSAAELGDSFDRVSGKVFARHAECLHFFSPFVVLECQGGLMGDDSTIWSNGEFNSRICAHCDDLIAKRNV